MSNEIGPDRLKALIEATQAQYKAAYGREATADELVAYAKEIGGTNNLNIWDGVLDNDQTEGNTISDNRYFADGDNLLFQTENDSNTELNRFLMYDVKNNKYKEITDKKEIAALLDKMDGSNNGVLTDSKGNTINIKDFLSNPNASIKLTKDGFEIVKKDPPTPPIDPPKPPIIKIAPPIIKIMPPIDPPKPPVIKIIPPIIKIKPPIIKIIPPIDGPIIKIVPPRPPRPPIIKIMPPIDGPIIKIVPPRPPRPPIIKIMPPILKIKPPFYPPVVKIMPPILKIKPPTIKIMPPFEKPVIKIAPPILKIKPPIGGPIPLPDTPGKEKPIYKINQN